MDIRLGNGFDVHAFGPGDQVTLCGVTIPHSQGLVGHSDADVGMHTVADAIYGALARGDEVQRGLQQLERESVERWEGLSGARANTPIVRAHKSGREQVVGSLDSRAVRKPALVK